MPCSDGFPSSYEQDRIDRENELKRRLDLSTKLLCGVMRRLRKLSRADEADDIDTREIYPMLLGNIDLDMQVSEVPGLREWWINHQREDRERKKREARRAHDDQIGRASCR